jgi:hypothetical protein
MTSELEFNLALTERESEGKTMKVHKLFRPFIKAQTTAGIATRYGLSGLGFETPVRARFCKTIQIDPEAHPSFCTMVACCLSRW